MTKLASIDLNLLHALHVVLTERSVARAAARLHITPSAVSNALARARKQLGDPLMVREGRYLVPTARALALQPALANALGDIETALRPDTLDPAKLTAAFTIGVSDYAEAVFMPDVLADLSRRAPGASVRLVPVLPALASRALHTGDASLLIGVFHAPPSDCHVANLWRDEMVSIARRGHPTAKRRLTLEMYLELPHVAVGLFGGPSAVDSALRATDRVRRVAFTVATFVGAPLVVASTDCIATVPRRLAERFAAPLNLRIFTPPVEVPGFTMQAMWHARTDAAAPDQFLRAIIRSRVALPAR